MMNFQEKFRSCLVWSQCCKWRSNCVLCVSVSMRACVCMCVCEHLCVQAHEGVHTVFVSNVTKILMGIVSKWWCFTFSSHFSELHFPTGICILIIIRNKNYLIKKKEFKRSEASNLFKKRKRSSTRKISQAMSRWWDSSWFGFLFMLFSIFQIL